MILGTLMRRIKKDLTKITYIKTYERFISDLSGNGFKVVSLQEANNLIGSLMAIKIAGLRHDVDIHNVAANRMFFEIEKKYGATSTYYFRKKTAKSHKFFISELLQNGFEVGYHYEEGSDIAKVYNIKSKKKLLNFAGEIKLLFNQNVESFRHIYNPDLCSVCAHGDWINRKLGFINYDFVDQEMLVKLGIKFEAYQSDIFKTSDFYLTDTVMGPDQWNYENVLGMSRIYILTHDRDWCASPMHNMQENCVRIFETLKFNLSPQLFKNTI